MSAETLPSGGQGAGVSTKSGERELRLALAMRGGVSLAIWIGGACAEIEALRLSAGDNTRGRTEFYRQLLGPAGFDSVVIDIVSGASAGGLNGALLATSLLYGVDFADLKGLWFDIADLGALVRNPRDPEPPSVLKGDDYFLPELFKAIQGRIETASPPVEPPRSLDLFLATTLMKPVEVPVLDDWATRYSERTQRAVFHFRHNEFTSDMPPDPSGPATEAIAYRLALAARSSSSFPGAFEPATVFSKRPKQIGERADPSEKENLFGIFSIVPEDEGGKTRVMDGGVLDNIPVERAIRATAEASADGPTKRWLVFLHPSPDLPNVGGDALDETAEEGPPAARTALSALTTAAGSESLLDDLTVLMDHNSAASRYEEMYVAELSHLASEGVAGAIVEATRRYPQYLALRAWFAADRITKLLEDPVSVLGEDPFTTKQQMTPLLNNARWTNEARLRLRREIRSDFAVPPPWPEDAPLAQEIDEIHQLGVTALIRALDSMIAVARKLEKRSRGDDAFSQICDVKNKLYSLRTVAALLDHLSDLFWPVYASVRVPPPEAPQQWVRDALAARDEFTRVWLGSTLATSGAVPAELCQLFTHLRAELHSRRTIVESHTREHIEGDAPGDDIGRDLWDHLVGYTVELSSICSTLGGAADPGDDSEDLHLRIYIEALAWVTEPGDVADWLVSFLGTIVKGSESELAECVAELPIVEVPEAPAKRAVQLLAAFEVLSFPLAMTALSGRQPINFLRIAGSNRTPLEGLFPGGRLELADKLAGNEVKNFSAFYAKSWRANDWMWGRVDASTSLVELLVQGESLLRHFGSAKELVAWVEGVVTLPPPQVVEDHCEKWNLHFKELWEKNKDAVCAESTRLFQKAGESTELTRTKDVLVARRHWDLLIEGLPDVVNASAGEDLAEGVSPTWQPSALTARQRRRIKSKTLMQKVFAAKAANGADPLKQPDGMRMLLGNYRVGRETIAGDAGSDRFTETFANLAVVAWKAFTKDLPPKTLISLVGVVLRILRAAALTVVKAPKWGPWLLAAVLVLSMWVLFRDEPVWIFNRGVAITSAVGTLLLVYYFAGDIVRRVMLIVLISIGVGLLVLARNMHAELVFGLGKADTIVEEWNALQVAGAAVVIVFVGYLIGQGAVWTTRRLTAWLSEWIEARQQKKRAATEETEGVERAAS